MKIGLLVIAVATIILSVSAYSKRSNSSSGSNPIQNVMKTNTLKRILDVSDDVEIYVDTSSIEEYDDDSFIRKALVIYRFKNPISFKGLKFSYMKKETFYSCKDHIFINGDIIFYDGDANPLAKGPETEVEVAEEGSNVGKELEYVCGVKAPKVNVPRNDPSPVKPMNHYDI